MLPAVYGQSEPSFLVQFRELPIILCSEHSCLFIPFRYNYSHCTFLSDQTSGLHALESRGKSVAPFKLIFVTLHRDETEILSKFNLHVNFFADCNLDFYFFFQFSRTTK